ncbi:(2Fe-2S)-binding protein [Methylobacter sp. YRD-M1]|uniref:(2Fe-2S)-binding protein n=1 Tax=Methylobacter sp. YRD-M1 TaxID=2911520 RepID=UPI00227D6D76|nr:(2Fe-2S)-binding protein [Methylobacter sp. YRD-M1]WAK04213.1 (2Fe-2S)-binding protein [Methylobacter sp. YRD-M1]
MYVCICKAVTDSQIQAAIEKGICSHKQLVQCFGVGKDCGKCSKEVNAMIKRSSTATVGNADLSTL